MKNASWMCPIWWGVSLICSNSVEFSVTKITFFTKIGSYPINPCFPYCGKNNFWSNYKFFKFFGSKNVCVIKGLLSYEKNTKIFYKSNKTYGYLYM